MFTDKSLLISAILSVFFLASSNSYAQCNTRFSYSVEQNKNLVSSAEKIDFSISLKLEEGSRNSKIELFDLYTGETVEKKDFDFSIGESKLVFTNVKPSRYLIYIQNENCKKKSITKGIEGIEIK